MNFQLFVKNYKSNDGKKTFEEFIKKHITKDYIPYLEKIAYCEAVVKATSYTTVNERQIVKINRPGQFITFTMRLIDLYTDIEINFNDGKFVEQYDELNKIGAIDSIVQHIPESEYTEFSTLLNMVIDDFRENEYSITAMLYNIKNSIDLAGETFIQGLNEVLDKPEVKEILDKLKDENN